MSFVAISRVNFPAHLREQVLKVGMEMLPVARKQPGYIHVAFHQSSDRPQTMMYWEWGSEADHEACMQSADWGEIMQRHGAVFAADGVEFSVETFFRLD